MGSLGALGGNLPLPSSITPSQPALGQGSNVSSSSVEGERCIPGQFFPSGKHQAQRLPAKFLSSTVEGDKKKTIHNVMLLGGTFWSVGADDDYELDDSQSPEEMAEAYNAMVGKFRPSHIEARVQEEQPDYFEDSRNVTPHKLLISAKRERKPGSYSFINGTDGLVQAALMNQLANPAPPDAIYVWTGAMKPSNSSVADNQRNATDAEIVAASNHPALLGHTVIVMNGLILDPRNARKVHTSSVDAFEPIEGDPIGYIKDGKISIVNPPPPVPQIFDLQGVDKLPHIHSLRIDITDSVNRHWLELKNNMELETASESEDRKKSGAYKKVILIEGAGNGIVSKPYIDELSKLARSREAIVLRCAGLHAGPTSSGMKDEELGFVHSGDIKRMHLKIYIKCYLAWLRKQGQEPTTESIRDFVKTMQFRQGKELDEIAS